MRAEIDINTGLNGFVMLDSVVEVSASHIVGVQTFSDDYVFLCLESLAQLGAYHIRYLIDFSRHIFLIKIDHMSLPPGNVMEGKYLLRGNLLYKSESSFLCRLKAEIDNKTIMEGNLLFAAVDYDHNFRSDDLRHHYTRVFSCLRKDIKTG